MFSHSRNNTLGFPTDANGNPFLPIPFPSVKNGGSASCAPLSVPSGSLVTVNTGSATMAPLPSPGGVSSLSVYFATGVDSLVEPAPLFVSTLYNATGAQNAAPFTSDPAFNSYATKCVH